MQLHRLTHEHEKELQLFFESFELEGLVQLRLLRPHGFFQPYRLTGEPFITYALKRGNDWQATATFLFSGQYPHKFALATDLRVLPSRQATIAWHQNFIPVLEEIRREHEVTYITSLLSFEDKKVLNTFLRSHPFKRQTPRYHWNQNYELTAIFGFWPGHIKQLQGYRVRPATREDWPEVEKFILRHGAYLPTAAWIQQLNETQSRLGSALPIYWVCQHEKSRRIEGFLATHPGTWSQWYVPLRYSLSAHNFRQFLKFMNMFGFTHRLTKPKSRTGEDWPLKFFHVSHIHVAHADIFEFMLSQIWRHLRSDEFMLYLRPEKHWSLVPSRRVISARLPYAAYVVTLPGEKDPEQIESLSLPWQSYHLF